MTTTPAPTWRLRVDTTGTKVVAGGPLNVWIVEGSGEKPTLEDLSPPVVVPPSPPPAPPGDPLAPRPAEDTSPFVRPAGGPTKTSDPSGDRQYPLGLGSPVEWWFYANLAGAGNPSPGSHKWGGIIGPGAMTDYGTQTPKDVSNMDLWVLVKTDFEDPMTGVHVPPPPGYIIRRALKHGRCT